MLLVFYVLCVLTAGCEAGTGTEQRTCRQSTMGGEYMGPISTTMTGLTCQRWDDQTPHDHNYTDPAMFRDDTMADTENFCRNPEVTNDQGQEGPWCYTMDPATRWEYCDIPFCGAYPEGRLTEEGTEYRGTMSQTESGADCLFWDEVLPQYLATHEVAAPFQVILDDDANYCRNPSNDPDGPWCIIDDFLTPETCKIPFTKPSASCRNTALGDNYVGTISMTESYRPCQRWDKQFPQSHNFTDNSMFPDATVSEAVNFCRNPSGDGGGLWCYTQDPQVLWEYCDIPICIDCKTSGEGRDYSGTLAVTELGRTCQRWDSSSPHPHGMTDSSRYSDASLADASNYCRNPDNKRQGPWCFTTDPEETWEFCDITMCAGDCENEPKEKKVQHVFHFGIDGLHPCFVDAPGGAPNILQRIANQGSYTITGGRSIYATISGAAWTATFTGSGQETTGSDSSENAWRPPWKGWDWPITPTTGKEWGFPTIFSTLKSLDNNVHTGSFYSWYWHHNIKNYGHPGSVDYERFFPHEERYEVPICDEYAVSNVSVYLNNVLQAAESSYTFLYIDTVDNQGHLLGWCTPEWMDWVPIIDAWVGQVLDVIDDLRMEQEVLVILHADHGSGLYEHGGQTDEELTIPMMMRGPGIRKAHQVKFPVRIEDSVNTALYLMGFKNNPWWTGRLWNEVLEVEPEPKHY